MFPNKYALTYDIKDTAIIYIRKLFVANENVLTTSRLSLN